MDKMQSNKKLIIAIIVGCIVIAIIAVIIIATSGDNSNVDTNKDSVNNDVNGGNTNNQGEIISNKENKLDDETAQKLFNDLPLVYAEEFAPFSDDFMLTSVMRKVSKEENPNYTASHIDNMVEEIFGDGVKINKDKVSDMDITRSLYYYNKDTGTYCIIPVGMESLYMTQLLKYATKDDNYTYVYTNEINGAWHQEEEKTVVVIGDKDGKDLVKSFDNYEDINNYNIWQSEHGDILPIYRYTLKEKDSRYILVGVEKVNY